MKKLDVLLIQQNQVRAKTIASYLYDASIANIMSAACEEDAFFLLNRHDFDVIIMDFKLRVSSCPDMSKIIRSVDPDIGILCIAPHDDGGCAQLCDDAAIDEVLSLPLDAGALVNMIEKLGMKQRAAGCLS